MTDFDKRISAIARNVINSHKNEILQYHTLSCENYAHKDCIYKDTFYIEYDPILNKIVIKTNKNWIDDNDLEIFQVHLTHLNKYTKDYLLEDIAESLTLMRIIDHRFLNLK